MKKTKMFQIIVLLMFMTGASFGESFTIGIMQDKAGVAKKYRALVKYLKTKDITVKLRGFRDYSDAAKKFSEKKVDGMFSGSGTAGSMIIKGLAYPVVRPVNINGWSTYWAVVIAPKGSAKYTGNAAYFKNKKIICCSLASSGEFYVRSVAGIKIKLQKASSHGAAIIALNKGDADVAVVKNRVWDTMKSKYPNLEMVGKDNGENPNGTLIVSNKANKTIADKIKNILLNIESDNSAEAKAVKKALKIKKYIPTTKANFSHTLPMLKQAGVTKNFNFKY